MKGVVVSVLVVILTILILGMAALNIIQTNAILNQEVEIAFKKAEIIKTKNIFYLMNRSLETTWFVSSVQNIFDAGETSLGVPYWYEIDMHNIANIYRPSRAEGREDLVEYLNENMEEYTDSVAGDVTLPDSVLISISDIESEFDYLEDTETDTITAEISQNLEVSYVDTVSRAVSTTTLGIPTVFLDMIEAGSLFVNAMIIFKSSPASYAYLSTYSNKEDYYSAVENNLINLVGPLLEGLFPDTVNIREIGLEDAEVFVPNTDISDYNAVDIVPSQAGLVLHSIAYCIIEEDNEGFYYHDEAANEFIKQPFFLDVKANTYLSALRCSPYMNFFGYEKSMDMACLDSQLYTCDILIPGEDANHNLKYNDCLTNEIECDDDTDIFSYCAMKLCQRDSCSGDMTYTPAVCCDEFCSDGDGCDCPCPETTPVPIPCDDNMFCTTDTCNTCFSSTQIGSKVDSCGCSPCSYTPTCPACCDEALDICIPCPTTTTTVPPPVCPDGCWVSGTQCCCYDPIMGEICF